MSKIIALYRHPVKGLSPEALDRVTLTAGEGLPFDRAYALTNGRSTVSADVFEWHPKSAFLMLQRDEKLAALKTEFSEQPPILRILRNGKQVARGDLSSPIGRAMIEDFFAAYMGQTGSGKPKIVHAPTGAMYSDHNKPVVSLHSLSSLRDLERVAGRAVDPLRFRGNVWIDGVDPWVEFSWVGREITIGAARLRIKEPIDRCAATNVDPHTGVRDMNIPRTLQHGFSHIDFGVFADVIEGGDVAIGDAVTL